MTLASEATTMPMKENCAPHRVLQDLRAGSRERRSSFRASTHRNRPLIDRAALMAVTADVDESAFCSLGGASEKREAFGTRYA